MEVVKNIFTPSEAVANISSTTSSINTNNYYNNNIYNKDNMYNVLTRPQYDECYSRSQFPTINEIENNKMPKTKIFTNIERGLVAHEVVLPQDLTNKRDLNQLYVRPYLGQYMGAGTASVKDEDLVLESVLRQGSSTKLRNKTSEPVQGAPLGRFECLPEFGNPQRLVHILSPPISIGGWQDRIGAPTRDYVRRVDYYRRCAESKKY